MKFSKGFTLSEILIAMLVLGIIVAASVPVILNLTPNKNAIMMKKAYYATESIIHSLINDPNAYPDKTVYCDENGSNANGGNCYFGFEDQDEEVYVSGVGKVSGMKKFRCLFASKLNIKEDLNNVCNGDLEEVTTMDGITWFIGKLDSGDDELEIDVDGKDKGVNAYYLKTNKGSCPSAATWGLISCNAELKNRAKKNFDRIQIKIGKDGQLSIDDQQEEFLNILNGTKKLIGGDDDEDE